MPVTFNQIANDIAKRMKSLFLKDSMGHRPIHGNEPRFRDDPHWRDIVLFYEYFNGDNGKGLGASHQTGWTALIANLIDEWH